MLPLNYKNEVNKAEGLNIDLIFFGDGVATLYSNGLLKSCPLEPSIKFDRQI